MKKFRDWELTNVHQERWSFGKGWSLVRFSAHLVEPQIQPLIGFPQEWSSGTKGPVTAEVVRVQIANEADLSGVDEKLYDLVRGRSLTINAIEAFIDRTAPYPTARRYRDGPRRF